ncbi:MAG TPA: hypothetical protein VGK32_17820 [Vicinamibacterales bacterium]
MIRRAVDDPTRLAAVIRMEIAAIEPTLPLTDVTTVDEMVPGSMA